MSSVRTIRSLTLMGALALLFAAIGAQPRNADALEASTNPIVGSWLATAHHANGSSTAIITAQSGVERGELAVGSGSGAFAGGVGEWTRQSSSQFTLSIYRVRTAASGQSQLERTQAVLLYDAGTDSWATTASYTQYLDSAMRVVGATAGEQVRAVRIPPPAAR